MRRLITHQDLHCLTVSLSTLHKNHFPIDSLLKKKQKDDKYSLKFGAERIKEGNKVISCYGVLQACMQFVAYVVTCLFVMTDNIFDYSEKSVLSKTLRSL